MILGIKLNITSEPPSEPHQTTLNDLHTHMSESSSVTTGKDEKPDLNKVEGEVLDYAYEGAPRLPGKWTFAHDYSNSVRTPQTRCFPVANPLTEHTMLTMVCRST